MPVVAPAGTEVVILRVVEAVTTAVVPLNFTELLSGVMLKLVPVIVTVAPAIPEVGLKLAMVGEEGVLTIKSVELWLVLPPTVTIIFPVVALAGTVAVRLVAVGVPVMLADILPNNTVLLPAVVLKLVPVIVTEVPTGPLVGVKDEIEGGPEVVTLFSNGKVVK